MSYSYEKDSTYNLFFRPNADAFGYSEGEVAEGRLLRLIEGMEDRTNTKVIHAKVPLGEMFGYATDLRSQTQGRASYTMQFDSYEAVPKNIRDEIVSKNGGSAT